MANDEVLSSATVREYFVKNGGKVKRDDLFDHFRSQLDKFDESGISNFRDIVNSLASLQNIEGEKYFVLKKSRNSTTPVLLRRPTRHVTQRKDKGASLPASMRNFRFSAAEDAYGNISFGDAKSRPNARARATFRSESAYNEAGMRRNNSDTSITENVNDSGVDTAVSSLQSESPRGSRQSSEYDQVSQNSGDTGIFNEDDYYEHDVPSHVLTPLEKSWMMSAMAGNKTEIICQLEEDPRIVKFKDFIMTALHWAAKRGNGELVRLLVDRDAEVNIKSGGYTPLHLAAMHGKINVINILIDDYHANVHIRDHSGKEPKDVLIKNSSEEIKQKLADPSAAFALEELAKKFPKVSPADSSNQSGLSKYMEAKDTPKSKPKLKGGASFRFWNSKPKKVRRSDRPVIEHFDETGRQRLQSTLRNEEKDLYKMQRSNSGSLFPTSFYKQPSQSEQGEEKTDGVDDGEEMGTYSEEIEMKQRGRLLSRSYPESEFRNLARISESDAQVSSGDHKSPSGSLSSPTESDQSVSGSKVSYRTTGSDGVFEADKIKRRSYSESYLKKHASVQDELASTLTMEDRRKSTDDRPSVFVKDTASLEETVKQRSEKEGMLMLRLDSNVDKKSGDLFRGEELATFMTVPSHAAEVSTQPGKPSITGEMNGNIPGLGEKTAGKIFIEAKEKKARASLMSNEELKASESSGVQPAYPNNEIIPRFNNNYKPVSEIVAAEEEQNIETTQEPVRPPRKKDKTRKSSVDVNDHERNAYDFNNTAEYDPNTKASAAHDQWRAKGGVTGYKGEVYLGLRSHSSNSLNDYRFQDALEQRNVASTKQKSKSAKSQQADTNRQGYTRRKSDGFPVHRAHSEENMLAQHPRLDARRKSEGFHKGYFERVSNEEFLKPGPEYFRRKSEGFTDQPRSKSFSSRRKSEELPDEPRSGSCTDQRKTEGFNIRKEVSLDHPRRRTVHNSTAPWSNQTESRHVLPDVLLDSSRRRASYEYSGADTGSVKDSREDFAGSTQMSQRIPPPYRPPPALVKYPPPKDGLHLENQQSNRLSPSRPNYFPPSPPTSKEPPPSWTTEETRPSNTGPAPPVFKNPPPYNRTPLEVYGNTFSGNPDPRSSRPPPKDNSLTHHSSEDLSRNTFSMSEPYPPPSEVSPIAPPRKHRVSIPSSDASDHPSPELSPTAPPRKNRRSPRRSSDDIHTFRPSYPLPSLPSSVPPARVISQEGEDYNMGREVSLDPTRRSRNFDPDDSTVVAASSYNPSEYDRDSFQSQSSSYVQSGPNEFFSSERSNFEEKCSNYRPPASNESYPSDSSYLHTSMESRGQYPSDSSRYYPSEYHSNSESTAARDISSGHESPSMRRRSAVDTSTRDQSPPEEVVLARDITSEPERYPISSGKFPNNGRDTTDHSVIGKLPESSGDGYISNRRNGHNSQPQDIRSENEFNAISAVPRFEGYRDINMSRTEQNFAMETEPEFIVAKQMSSDAGIPGAGPVTRGSREDVDTLSGALGEEMKSKWYSTSSDGSNESGENRNKYRMTSMI